MSYGLKYTFTFREGTGTATTGALYKVNIYESGYAGSSTSVKASGSPLTLNYKKQDLISAICGSELTIGLMSVTNFQFIEFATAAPLQYYVDVLYSTNNGGTWGTYWSGVNTTDCYTEPYNSAPYSINLKFNCGLGELQWHRYENAGNLVGGLESIILIISNCLSFLPYNKNVREVINIREDTMSDSAALLQQLYLADISFTEIADDGELHGISCNKLLNNILTALNCRIYQSKNMWFVERIYERTQTSLTYFDYTLPGTFQLPGYSITSSANGSYDPRVSINNASQPKLIDGGDRAVTQKKPSLAYQYNTQGLDTVELITNPFFEDTPTTKTSQGEPLYWDFGTSIDGYTPTAVILKTVNPYSNNVKYRTGLCYQTTAINAFNTYVKSQYVANSVNWGGGTPPLIHAILDPNNAWCIHAVRSPGDTHSNPWLYIDPQNGSLNINFNLYFSYKVTPGAASAGNDANTILNGALPIGVPMLIRLTDSAGNTYNIWGYNIQTGTQWAKNSDTMAAMGGSSDFAPAALNNNFPDPAMNGQATPVNQGQFLAKYAASYGSSSSFYWNFLAKYNFNAPFDTSVFGTSAGVYSFDLYVWPPVIGGSYSASDPFNGALANTTVTLDEFGLNTLDIQYKDSYQSTSGYTVFYSAPDNDTRWNEQKVSVMYGDTLTPGYPGSFRLSTAVPTASWHNRGHTDTGQLLSDILFKNYAGLIANYRVALTGKILNSGGINFFSNINDGTYVYAPTGLKLNFKQMQLTMDMEEVSHAPAVITKGFGSKTTTSGTFLASLSEGQPAHQAPFTQAHTAVATVAHLSHPSPYPTA